MKTNKIYYKYLGPRGLFNQVVSLETAVGIQHKADTDIIFYTDQYPFAINKPSTYDEKYKDMISSPVLRRIDDIFSWDSQDNFIFDYNLREADIKDVKRYDMFEYFLVDKDKETKNIEEFASGRSQLYIDNKDINFTNTLSLYSYFFYHRDAELDRKIGSISPKIEYLNLAKQIAESLGDFDGIHLRLTDFPIYILTVTEDMFREAFNHLDSGRNVVVSTDEPDNYILKNLNKPIISLDKYIYENFFDEFKALPISDEIVFGLINNLVMHYSKDFIGTLGSSYTSYIQRGRANMGLTPSWKCFTDLEYKKTGNYSWTNYPVKNDAKSWWKCWEESILIKS
jgi:hypothetical protein